MPLGNFSFHDSEDLSQILLGCDIA